MPLQDYYNTNDDGQTHFYGTEWAGQSFTASSNYDISSVKLKLFRVGSPGTITVSIRATDGDGKPTGGDLASGTLDGNALTTDGGGEWKEVTFDTPYSLTSATVYAIVVRAPSGSAPNRGDWRKDYTAPSYSGGQYLYSSDSGSTWSVSATADHMFETWGDPTAVYADCSGTCAGAGSGSGDLGFTEIHIQHVSTTKRLVVAGHNQIWFEDA